MPVAHLTSKPDETSTRAVLPALPAEPLLLSTREPRPLPELHVFTAAAKLFDESGTSRIDLGTQNMEGEWQMPSDYNVKGQLGDSFYRHTESRK